GGAACPLGEGVGGLVEGVEADQDGVLVHLGHAGQVGVGAQEVGDVGEAVDACLDGGDRVGGGLGEPGGGLFCDDGGHLHLLLSVEARERVGIWALVRVAAGWGPALFRSGRRF